jgi:hypothetical protein
MQLRFFTIPLLGGEAAAEELNRFLASHRILAVDRHLAQDSGVAIWAVCVSYEPAGESRAGDSRSASGRRGKIDYREVRAALDTARAYTGEVLHLEAKDPPGVGESRHGVMLCGYRVLPGRLLLSRRRKRRYTECRRQWEEAYAVGTIDARALQAGYSAALGMTLHADAVAWRREQLRRVPLAGGLTAL